MYVLFLFHQRNDGIKSTERIKNHCELEMGEIGLDCSRTRCARSCKILAPKSHVNTDPNFFTSKKYNIYGGNVWMWVVCVAVVDSNLFCGEKLNGKVDVDNFRVTFLFLSRPPFAWWIRKEKRVKENALWHRHRQRVCVRVLCLRLSKTNDGH